MSNFIQNKKNIHTRRYAWYCSYGILWCECEYL